MIRPFYKLNKLSPKPGSKKQKYTYIQLFKDDNIKISVVKVKSFFFQV